MGERHGAVIEVELARDCPAVIVPWGTPATLAAGRRGFVSQRLGGTVTVMVDGNLYRVDERDADALGLEPSEVAPEHAAGDAGAGGVADAASVEAAAWRVLGSCYDPEIPIDIVNLGLVYGCDVTPTDDGRFAVSVRMTLTAPGCGMGTLLADEARAKLQAIPGVARADVELVWDPPWGRERISEAARLEMGLL